MRGGSINGEEEFGGIICPSCFAVLAEQAGLGVTGWRFIPEQVLAPLETVTPSGRVWSDAEFRWIELAAGVQPEGS
jgi:hypothetical protein